MRFHNAAAVALSVSTTFVLAQKPASLRKRDETRAEAVKDVFKFSWDGYYKLAFPHDELHPVTNGTGDSRNGWGASAVDALTTALVMEIPEIVDEILTHIKSIDYTSTETEVSMFETTIRYLGGMLSGYDLLNGPLTGLDINRDNVPVLLEQSKTLADKLKFAFDTPTGIPYNDLWFTNNSVVDPYAANGLAQIGTLVLEWTRLSDLINDTQYTDLAKKGEEYLLNPKPSSSEPFPGLVGSAVNVTTGLFTNANGGWSGGTDSFYEYLIKMYVYDPDRFSTYKDRWVLAVDSTISNLTQHPDGKPWFTYTAEYASTRLISESGHLTCFHGGNFILGGTLLARQDLIDYGLELVNGCHNTYNSTLTKIGPERFSWNASDVPDKQAAFFEANGFWIDVAYYDLRPEVIESYYHAYRVTGDTKYQDWAWEAFVAINSTCRTQSGFAAINDVNAQDGGGFIDNQESFWFAEVMKYSYLIHAEDADWQISKDGKNKFVFNTEAHPFSVFNPPTSSNSSSLTASASASESATTSSGSGNGQGEAQTGKDDKGAASRYELSNLLMLVVPAIAFIAVL